MELRFNATSKQLGCRYNEYYVADTSNHGFLRITLYSDPDVVRILDFIRGCNTPAPGATALFCQRCRRVARTIWDKSSKLHIHLPQSAGRTRDTSQVIGRFLAICVPTWLLLHYTAGVFYNSLFYLAKFGESKRNVPRLRRRPGPGNGNASFH